MPRFEAEKPEVGKAGLRGAAKFAPSGRSARLRSWVMEGKWERVPETDWNRRSVPKDRRRIHSDEKEWQVIYIYRIWRVSKPS